jgi:hypothetical protein
MASDQEYDASDVRLLSDLLDIIEQASKLPQVDAALKKYDTLMGVKIGITTITDTDEEQSVYVEVFGEDVYGA